MVRSQFFYSWPLSLVIYELSCASTVWLSTNVQIPRLNVNDIKKITVTFWATYSISCRTHNHVVISVCPEAHKPKISNISYLISEDEIVWACFSNL